MEDPRQRSCAGKLLAVRRTRMLEAHLRPTGHVRHHRSLQANLAAKKKSDPIEVDGLDTLDPSEPDYYGEEFDVKLEQNAATGRDELVAIPHVLSFDQGFFHAVRAIELMRDLHPENVVIVGVAGPPGSGKTTFARKMHELLGDSLVLPLESFVRVDSVIDGNFDDISLVDFELVTKVLTELRAGREADIPQVTIFSPELRKRTGFTRTAPPASRVVILEGSYALNTVIRPLLDITIAITGGVHLDLIKRILRDIHSANKQQKDVLLRVTNVMFPMYKAFIEPDLESAKIRIHSTYNPMAAMVDPVYSCKAKLSEVTWNHEKFVSSLPTILGDQGGVPPGPLVVKEISDMYLSPPRALRADVATGKNRKNWIRIRRMDGLFYIHFYSEIMGGTCNTRPTVNFEISVKAISGLLSLGYEIGAILHRTTETWYDANGLLVTKESIKELQKDYIQIKGRHRKAVVALSEQMGMADHHIPLSFLQLYFRKLQKDKDTASAPAPTLPHTAAAFTE